MDQQRRLIKKDADGEYIQHDGARFAITWDADRSKCPAPGYPVMAQPQPKEWPFIVRHLILFRAYDRHSTIAGTEYLGSARRTSAA